MATLKTQLMDEAAVTRALTRIAHEIIEKNHGVDGVCLVGIHRRGVPLAEILQRSIESIEGVSVQTGSVDIMRYRDDLSSLSPVPQSGHTGISFDVTGKRVVLVDDVLYTGRTVRAAMEAVLATGRPAAIQLAILIDRGHRELPIRADFVGKNIPTAQNEMIAVSIPPYDDEVSVKLYER